MDNKNIIEHLLNNGNILKVLCKSNIKKQEVIEFQIIMSQLGFDEELNFKEIGADGYYGNCCIAAVKSFGIRNKIETDGTVITEELARQLIDRYDTLDELQDLKRDIDTGEVTSVYKVGSLDKGAVASLQTLLHELGYGKELQWHKYHNDGVYGNATKAAVKAYMNDEGIEGDFNVLSMEVARKICDDLSKYYGSGWANNMKKGAKDDDSIIKIFSGSNFQGKKVKTVSSFIPALNKLNQYAKDNNVKIHVTSSIRMNANVNCAIVKPAQRSNHMAGHAIDMNIAFPGGWANSTYLKKENENSWDKHVIGFINDIRKDEVLRWGGDFNPEDPVHIDDGLNIRNKDEWERCYNEIQNA